MVNTIFLRKPLPEDAIAFTKAARASRDFHAPWTTAPTTAKQYAEYLARMDGVSNFPYLVCDRRTEELLGVINLTNVVMGAFRSGYLGYYVFAGFEGQGRMKEALSLVIKHAFKALKLHRLEANIQPANQASISLVKACGFQLEGYSPRYLKINGRWRDHERWAILAT